MPVRSVDHDHIHARIDQRLRPFKTGIARGGCCGHAQTAQTVLARGGVQNRLFGVLEGQKTRQFALPVGHQQFLDPAGLHQADRFFAVGGFVQDGQFVDGHHQMHRCVIGSGETHVAVGHNAHDAALFIHHRKTGDVIALLQCFGVRKGLVGAQGDRVVNDPAFKPFDAAHLFGLFGDGQVAMHHAHAARLGHGNRHAAFGHCVHRRAEQRDVQSDRICHICACVSRRRQHARCRWHQ